MELRRRSPPLSTAVMICLCLLVLPLSIVNANNELSRSVRLDNRSNLTVAIHWIHTETGEPHVTIPQVHPNFNVDFSSYVGHDFQVRELPADSSSGICKHDGNDRTCRISYFSVTEKGPQVYYVHNDLVVDDHEEDYTIDDGPMNHKTSSSIDECEDIALNSINSSSKDPVKVIKGMVKCIESSVTDKIIKANQEIAAHAKTRESFAERFENYTCADYGLPSTEALWSQSWVHGETLRNVDVLHERSASKVHLIKNFISPEECEAMEESARKRLHSATVADGKGGSELSPNRKAKQAGISIPWKKEAEGNLLTKISRRVYDYTNHVLNLGIEEHGQEDLMSIQYKGRGEEDKEPDRYMPHCDGDCNGLPFREGQRMATIVMYCTVPSKGGATNFRKSGLHVQPEEGSATFFSYINPKSFKMDTGFTEHSGCPVIEGEKKIVTQWVRYGVDGENPWSSFNTLGIKNANKQ